MDGTTTQQTTTTSEKSSIATLSNLGIKPNDFSGFKANTYTYNVEVPNDVESVEVYASKGQSGQTISGTGTKTLKEGVNTFEVVVTAEAGNTQKYAINVTRKEREETTEEVSEENSEEEPMKETFGLTELIIEGLELTPQFQTDVYEYKVELKEDLEKLKITTLETDVNSEIEITGNENLQEGENIITIIVKGENDAETVAYQIIVNKTTSSIENTINLEEDHQQMISKIIILAIAGGIIFVIVIAVIIVKIKKSKELNDSYIPYENLTNDYEDDNELEEQTVKEDKEEYYEEEIYEEEPKKKKRSKGKRFK